jgi:hypothetical protein
MEIPPDVLLLIGKHLLPDQLPTLATLLLTCKSNYSLLTPVLFSHLELRSDEQLAMLLNALGAGAGSTSRRVPLAEEGCSASGASRSEAKETSKYKYDEPPWHPIPAIRRLKTLSLVRTLHLDQAPMAETSARILSLSNSLPGNRLFPNVTHLSLRTDVLTSLPTGSLTSSYSRTKVAQRRREALGRLCNPAYLCVWGREGTARRKTSIHADVGSNGSPTLAATISIPSQTLSSWSETTSPGLFLVDTSETHLNLAIWINDLLSSWPNLRSVRWHNLGPTGLFLVSGCENVLCLAEPRVGIESGAETEAGRPTGNEYETKDENENENEVENGMSLGLAGLYASLARRLGLALRVAWRKEESENKGSSSQGHTDTTVSIVGLHALDVPDLHRRLAEAGLERGIISELRQDREGVPPSRLQMVDGAEMLRCTRYLEWWDVEHCPDCDF